MNAQSIGTSEAGSTVTVKGSDGKLLGTTVTNATGNYAVDLIPALTNGEVVNITATNTAGNESTATQVTADDTTRRVHRLLKLLMMERKL